MNLISNFDIHSDFYSDPQIRSIFNEEIENKVPSKVMWALMLFHHPDSKYYSQEAVSKKQLIEQDYLKEPLAWEEYESTVSKIERFLMSKAKRFLKTWEDDFEERDAFMKSLPYDLDHYKVKEELMTSRLKQWQNYLDILKKVKEEDETRTRGDIELSLMEKGIFDE